MPLALEQAGAYISDNHIHLGEYVSLFKRYRRELLGYKPTLRSIAKETVLTVWEISFNYIEQTDKAAAELLLLMVFFDNETCWEGLCRFHTGGDTNDVGLLDPPELEWLSELLKNGFKFRSAFTRLMAVSLVKRDSQPESLRFHPLVHAWGRDRLTTSHRKSKIFQALVLLHNALVSTTHVTESKERWSLQRRILPHVDAVLKFLHLESGLIDEFSQKPLARQAMLEVATLYKEFGRAEEAEIICRKIMDADSTADDATVYQTQKLLGEVLYVASRFKESSDIYRAWLAKQSNRFDLANPDIRTFHMVLGLGCVLERATQLHDSQHYLLLAKSAAVTLQGIDKAEVRLRIAQHLLMVYWGMGKLVEAEDYANQATTEIGAKYGPKSIEFHKVYYRLGIIYHETGRWEAAEKVFQQVYDTFSGILGEEHSETLRLLNALGRERMFLGRYHEGADLLRKAVEIQERNLGPAHIGTLRSQSNLGELYRRQGLYKEAGELLDRSIMWMENSFAETQREALSIKADKGLLLSDLGEYEAALKLLSEVKMGQEAAFAEGLSDTFTTSRGLGEVLTNLSRFVEAEEEFERLLPQAKKVWGLQHPKYMLIQISLARLYIAQRRYSTALDMLKMLVKELDTRLGAQHPITLDAQGALAESLYMCGERAEGVMLWDIAISGTSATLGRIHPRTVKLIQKRIDLAGHIDSDGLLPVKE
jgi:tetratricopeptide (TPR) repeat protein